MLRKNSKQFIVACVGALCNVCSCVTDESTYVPCCWRKETIKVLKVKQTFAQALAATAHTQTHMHTYTYRHAHTHTP